MCGCLKEDASFFWWLPFHSWLESDIKYIIFYSSFTLLKKLNMSMRINLWLLQLLNTKILSERLAPLGGVHTLLECWRLTVRKRLFFFFLTPWNLFSVMNVFFISFEKVRKPIFTHYSILCICLLVSTVQYMMINVRYLSLKHQHFLMTALPHQM